MRKTAMISIVCSALMLIAVFELPLPAKAQEGEDVILYLYGDDPISSGGYFLTDAPTSNVGESNDYGPSGGVALLYVLGTWETDPLQKDLHINGQVSVAVWLENENPLPSFVTVYCDILIDGVETGQRLESDETMLGNSPQELAFTGYVDVYLDVGERFGIYMTVRYRGSGFTFYWAHMNYDSRITAPADWVYLDIAEPIIDEANEEATIEATVIDALGTDEIVDYDIEIDGPTIASSILGPELSQQGNAMIASWVWEYGADNAQGGVIYTAIVTITDNSGNEWTDTEDFYVGGEPPPPPAYNWTVIGQITNYNGDDFGHSLMIDNGGTFWLVYTSERSGNYDIWVKNSTDGVTWSTPIQVTTNESYDGWGSFIQDSGGTYWMAWFSDRSGTVQIWMSNSSDGINWDEPYQVVSLMDENVYPSLIQDSGGTYWLAWMNFDWDTWDIYLYVSSSSDGLTWTAPTRVTSATSDEWEPSLIQDDTGIYRLVWDTYSAGSWEIWGSYSNDGVNWNTPIQITSNGGDNWYPSLIQNASGGFDIAFSSYKTGDWEIWRISSEDGLNWGHEDQVTNLEGSIEFDPSLVQDNDETFWVAWFSDVTGNFDIWMSNKPTNTPPRLETYNIAGEQEGDITLEYRLIDHDNDLCGIEPEYSTDGVNFHPATQGEGGDGTANLASSPSGIVHTFVWASGIDLQGIDDTTVYLRMIPSDLSAVGESDTTNAFHVDNNMPPGIGIDTVSGEQSEDVTIYYRLFDVESDTLSINAEYSQDGENFFQAAKGSGGDPTSGLTSSPEGTQHSYVWDSKVDLDGIDDETVYFRITPSDADIGGSLITDAFQLDNNAPPRVEIDALSGEKTENVIISYILFDVESDTLNIIAELSQNGQNFSQATMGGGGDLTSDLASSPGGTQHSFVWDSKADLDGVDDETVYFRITPSDDELGATFTTHTFHLDNNEIPEVGIITPTGVQSGEVLISYTLKDRESDTSNILAEYSKDGVSYFSAKEGNGGDGKTALTTGPNGKIHTFSWNSKSDLKDTELSTVYFRITPNDNDEGPSGTTSAFTVDNKAPTIVSGPSVSKKTDTTATIEWDTDEPCNSVINYGKSTSNEFEVNSSAFVIKHVFTITGLEHDTGYLYRISSWDRSGNGPAESYEVVFTTAKPENHPPIVLVISPKQGDKVKGEIEVSGEVLDPDYWDKVEYVEYRIDDGEWTRTTGINQWSFKIDMKSLENGEHSIYIRAYDGDIYSQEVKLTIEVNNPEELGFWALLIIGAIIVIATVIKVAFVISKVRRRREQKAGLKQPNLYTQTPPTFRKAPTQAYEVEPMVVQALK
ncbi:MAG: Ig-like domain-containing protein [Thermoplasmata archaeon]